MQPITQSLTNLMPMITSTLNVEVEAWKEVEKAFLEKELDFNCIDRTQYSPLRAAVKLNDPELCKKILALGFPINSHMEFIKNCPLQDAIDLGFNEIALFLIENNANITLKDEEGFSYLHSAALKGHTEVCKSLLNRGIDVNVKVSIKFNYMPLQVTPLWCAVNRQQLKTVKFFLDQNATLDNGNHNENPFFLAVLLGNEEVIQLFLDKGAKLEQEDPYLGDGSPLVMNVFSHLNCNYEKTMKLLLKLGMNLNHRFSQNRTYLHWAATKSGDPKLCELFIKNGADIHAIDAEGKNVLHHAALNSTLFRWELISFLLTQGADASALNKVYETPLMLLEAGKLTNTNEYLDLKLADKGMTDLVRKLKMLGLRNSLSGNIFEGAYKFQSFFELAESLECFLKQNSTPPNLLTTFPEKLKSSPYISDWEVIGKVNNGEIVGISCGWEGHQVPVVISKDILIIGNRGENCGEQPGIKIYKIRNRDKLSEVIDVLISIRDYSLPHRVVLREKINDKVHSFVEIKEKIRKEARTNHIDFLNKKMIELLDLECIDYLRQKEQISGNCNWLGANITFQGFLIHHLLRDYPNIDRKELLFEIKKMVGSWKKYDSIHALTVLKAAEIDPRLKGIIDFESVYEELLAVNFFKPEVVEKLVEYHPRLKNFLSNPDSKMFSYAFKHQKLRLIKWLIAKDVKLQVPNFFELNPLIDEVLMDYFMKGGLSSNITDSNGLTPLHYFVTKDNKSHALKLLKSWKEEFKNNLDTKPLQSVVNQSNNFGLSPFLVLLNNSTNLDADKEIIDLFLDCKAVLPIKNDSCVSVFLKILQNVKTSEDVNILKSILLACPDVTTLINTKNFQGFTALDFAFSSSNPNELVQMFLEMGAQVMGHHFHYLKCPIINDAFLKYIECHGLFIEDKDLVNNATPLHALCANSNKEYAIQILKAWKKQAYHSGQNTRLKSYVNARILDVNVPHSDGPTSLIGTLYVCFNLESVKDLIDVLIDCGADISLETLRQNALHLAMTKINGMDDLNIIKILLKNSEDALKALNAKTSNLETPMHFIQADKEWSLPLAKIFIDHGAILYEDINGHYPGVVRNHVELMEYYNNRMHAKRKNITKA